MRTLLLLTAMLVTAMGLRYICCKIIAWCEPPKQTNPDDEYTYERMNPYHNDPNETIF